MIFTTVEFAVFFLVVLSLSWFFRGLPGFYKLFLLEANAVFYISFDARFLPLILLVGLVNWGAGYLIALSNSMVRKKLLLFAAIVLSLAPLVFFKYTEFFATSILPLLWHGDLVSRLPLMDLLFPIGISFFTFQGMSYAIDVYRDRERLVKNPLDILLFVSFFPTVLSGPIMRAHVFVPQLIRPVYSTRSFQLGFALILSGLFKKIVIASYLSEHIVRQVFQVPGDYSSASVLAAIYGYSVQIFCDFSGYSDLAIGVALLLGYKIPLNFNRPYIATDLQEFWHRWHISLSTWLRDYLYIPLGGNKYGTLSKYINIMITMTLGGLWHGAHMRFLLWGMLHGLGLVITHAIKDLRRHFRKPGAVEAKPNPLMKVFLWLLTFHFVSFTWVFFEAADTERAFEIFRAVFTDQQGKGFGLLVIPAIAVGLLLNFFGPWLQKTYLDTQRRLPLLLQVVVIALICIIILRMGPEGMLPFIYFQF
ncbi:MAG: MBOAT family O-acyltransferase [Thiothrix sp.]